MRRVFALSLALGILLSVPCLLAARESAGERHGHTTTGTVEKIEKGRLDVKGDDDKALTFVLTAKTTMLRGEATATTASVKPGERVSVEFEEASGVRTALKVRLGGPAATTRYTCSMHPDVVSDKPGKCPKCGMYLTPVESSKK